MASRLTCGDENFNWLQRALFLIYEPGIQWSSIQMCFRQNQPLTNGGCYWRIRTFAAPSKLALRSKSTYRKINRFFCSVPDLEVKSNLVFYSYQNGWLNKLWFKTSCRARNTPRFQLRIYALRQKKGWRIGRRVCWKENWRKTVF